MLSLHDINYEVVEQNRLTEVLNKFGSSDVAFDYETYNHVNGECAKEPWDEHTHPFMFSVCSLDDPEGCIKVFKIGTLTQEQKGAFEKFLTSRRVWSFNCKFEGAVTWKLLGKFIKFDDAQCLYKVSGRFIGDMSLKKGTAALLKVPEWSESTWDTLELLRVIVARVKSLYVKKGRTDAWVEAFLEGNVKRIYEVVDIKSSSTDTTKDEIELIRLLINAKPYLTPTLILCALAGTHIDETHLNLKYVPNGVVARYCAYDAYATAQNYLKLYAECKSQYPIFLKQSWLAMLMEAYGMTRDLKREKEIEYYYLEQILYYLQEVLAIREFTDMLDIPYVDHVLNPKTNKLNKTVLTRKGMELEDYAKIKEIIEAPDDDKPLRVCTDCKKADGYCSSFADREQYRHICIKCLKLYDLKEKYWNYNAMKADKVLMFYNALFASPMAKSAVQAYHIKKYLVQIEGFTEVADGQEISIAKKIKWNTYDTVTRQALKFVEDKCKTAKQSEDKIALEKWSKVHRRLTDTIREAYTLHIAVPSNDQKKGGAYLVDIRTSLKKENIEMLFSALCECADLDPDAPWDTIPWEMKLVFCVKVIKKLDKALTAWVRGQVGHKRVYASRVGESLLDVPVRTNTGNRYIFQPSFNACSAGTKRWISSIHAVPRGSELSEMLIPRYDDSILVHWDFGQAEVILLAVLAQETELLKLFYENPKADVHRLMASMVWEKKPEDVSGEERRFSKGLTFSITYGASIESMADAYFNGNITRATEAYQRFNTAFPNVLKWCNERHEQIDKYGYVQTLFGDKIYIESKSKGELHRRSQNYPVQSSSSNLAGYAIWSLWEYCQANNIEAIPQCFIHDSSDWDVRLRDLVRFIKATNKCAVADIRSTFNAPMKIDFEMGVNLNFTMHLDNVEELDNGIKFEFKCPDVFYRPLIDRLSKSYIVKPEITKTKVETESWANLFVTKRPYSMYLNKPINVFSGTLCLENKL